MTPWGLKEEWAKNIKTDLIVCLTLWGFLFVAFALIVGHDPKFDYWQIAMIAGAFPAIAFAITLTGSLQFIDDVRSCYSQAKTLRNELNKLEKTNEISTWLHDTIKKDLWILTFLERCFPEKRSVWVKPIEAVLNEERRQEQAEVDYELTERKRLDELDQKREAAITHMMDLMEKETENPRTAALKTRELRE